MGSVYFDGYGYNSSHQYVEINYSENYNANTNQTTVKLTSVYFKSSVSVPGPIYGTVKFDGTTVKTLSGGSTYNFNMSANSWTYVPSSSGSSVTVTHGNDGKATLSVGIGNYDGYFGKSYNGHWYNIGGTPKSTTINLTTHAATLTVNPNGGSWEGNTSSQTFTSAPSTTKTISNPIRTGYTFNGWSLSGGGSFTNGVYTFSETSGTLTALWTINSYTITCEDRLGSSTGRLIGSTTIVRDYNTTISGADFGSSTTPNIYYTGYYYTGSSPSITVTSDTTVYRYFNLISYILSITTSQQGVTPNISRTSSPIAEAATGQLTNGAVLYYNDVLAINYTLGGAYQLLTATVNGVDISEEPLPYNITVLSDVLISITAKLGAIIYIANQAYQVFIGDGTNWNQYQAFIGNGSSFDQY